MYVECCRLQTHCFTVLLMGFFVLNNLSHISSEHLAQRKSFMYLVIATKQCL